MSVRRSRPLDPGRRLPDLPDHLQVPCIVEEWISPAEAPPDWWHHTTVNGAPVDPRRETDWCELVARRRWKDARLRWAADRGMTWREFSGTYAHGSPRWLDRQAFLASRRGVSA